LALKLNLNGQREAQQQNQRENFTHGALLLAKALWTTF